VALLEIRFIYMSVAKRLQDLIKSSVGNGCGGSNRVLVKDIIPLFVSEV